MTEPAPDRKTARGTFVVQDTAVRRHDNAPILGIKKIEQVQATSSTGVANSARTAEPVNVSNKFA